MRYVVLGVFVAVIGAAAQEMIPGTARPLIESMPANTSGYICPMHPNEVKAEPGTCSICGMTLVPGDPMATADYLMRVTTEPRAPKPGFQRREPSRVARRATGRRRGGPRDGGARR